LHIDSENKEIDGAGVQTRPFQSLLGSYPSRLRAIVTACVIARWISLALFVFVAQLDAQIIVNVNHLATKQSVEPLAHFLPRWQGDEAFAS